MPTPSTGRQNLAAHLLLAAVTLIWGCTFPLVKYTLQDISPFRFNFLRMLCAAAVLCAINWRALRGLSSSQVKLCALAGLCLALGYELQTSGLAYTTPSKSAFLTGLVVVLVPPLSLVPGLHVAGTPRPRPTAYMGAGLAFIGIVLLTSTPGTGLAVLSGLHAGEWLTLGCALAYALHLLVLARGAHILSARTLGTLQIAFAALATLLFLPADRHPALHWTPAVVVALAVTSILATAFAFTVQSWAQQHLPPSHTALILTLEPVFAALFSAVFLHERLGPRALSGAALILGGIVLAELGPTAVSEAAILPLEP